MIRLQSKIDPVIRKLCKNKALRSIPIILLLSQPPDEILCSKLKRLKFKTKHQYFSINGLSGTIPAASLSAVSNLRVVKKIYFDGIACLHNEKTFSSSFFEKTLPKSFLTGKGVTIGIIDSGIYHHCNLSYSNGLRAYFDAMNHLPTPSDESGHGTACAGFITGAANDGSLTALAYGSQIVCAKAFNSKNQGRFSDIVMAMDWMLSIKEAYQIQLLLLPFGTVVTHQDFDLLSHCCKVLWQSGLFVIASAGNLGPNECSITSPGSSEFAFTIGSPTLYSSRGPTVNNLAKPDCLVAADHISTLSYVPNHQIQPTMYTTLSGTSASAALCAAYVALLYEKKPGIDPDTARCILRKCCTSINLLRNVQGAGVLDLSKIERL